MDVHRHLAVLAVVLWAIALMNVCAPGMYLRTGQVKGTDFVQFYAMARVAAAHEPSDLLDRETLRAAQLAAVPESEADYFPALYGPQVGLLLRPLASLPYLTALAVWAVGTLVAYLAAIAVVARRSSHVSLPLAVLAALAFPPFWLLMQDGHLTVVATVAMVGAWALLGRGHVLWAGVVLGVLAYKPQLWAPVFALLVVTGSWRMLLGLILGSAAQLVPVALVDPHSVLEYLLLLGRLPAQASALVTRPEQFQGWRGFWALLVPHAGTALVLALACMLLTLFVAARAWRFHPEPSVRLSTLGLAIGLMAPHLYTYDLVVLAPAWIWLTDWSLSRADVPRLFRWCLYLGFVAPLLGPLVAITHVQIVTPVLAVLLVLLARHGEGIGTPA